MLNEQYIFLGSCQDLSNMVYAADDKECRKPFARYCNNNLTCIHENLFCDGHEQCEDGSDEDEEFCQLCPRWCFLMVCLNFGKCIIVLIK